MQRTKFGRIQVAQDSITSQSTCPPCQTCPVGLSACEVQELSSDTIVLPIETHSQSLASALRRDNIPEASCSRPLRGFIAVAAPGSSAGCLRQVSDPSRALKVTRSKFEAEKYIENQDKFHYSEVNGAMCILKGYRKHPPAEGWDEDRIPF